MTQPIRVRYAPSPTGFPHVGNIRTALFNWLFARHNDGRFIIRIEDTDIARTVPGAVEAILDGVRWLGIDWDEGPEIGGNYGPYFQSQRLPLYQAAANRLVAQGDAYYCFCSQQRLEQMRKEQAEKKLPPGYDRYCRNLTKEQCATEEDKGIVPVVRFKMPLTGQTKFNDIIKGEVNFSNNTQDDYVLLKSDGYPTYHLANVIDDHAMEISHVMRAEEWLSSTPRHLLLYNALGYTPPQFAHLPMILGTDRSKLSKRHGSVSITEYREQGYLPNAMFNFLTLLGWSLDDKTEIITRDDIIKYFSLERISSTAAIFNIEKLKWMNGLYIRKLNIDEFYESVKPFLMADKDASRYLSSDENYVKSVLPLIHERTRTLIDAVELARFFFVDEIEYDTSLLIEKGMTNDDTLKALEITYSKIKDLNIFDDVTLENIIRPLAQELCLKTGQLFGSLRTATTGRIAAPPLFQTMMVLGQGRTLKRIEMAINKLTRLNK
jgi:glutamyl-tRNA synthetase